METYTTARHATRYPGPWTLDPGDAHDGPPQRRQTLYPRRQPAMPPCSPQARKPASPQARKPASPQARKPAARHVARAKPCRLDRTWSTQSLELGRWSCRWFEDAPWNQGPRPLTLRPSLGTPAPSKAVGLLSSGARGGIGSTSSQSARVRKHCQGCCAPLLDHVRTWIEEAQGRVSWFVRINV